MKRILSLIAAFLFLGTVRASEPLSIEQCKTNINAMVAKMNQGATEGPYRPNWQSVTQHEAQPEWFLDGKVGIYFHWGVYSVPAHGNEWYMRKMHIKTGPEKQSYYEHHRETWGEPDEFGYHDFVPMFKAQHFDASEWADLFVKSGARWAGPVCEHHDGYSMWDSEMTPWNAADTGPKRDITGELAKAVKDRGLKFVTTFHHERSRNWVPRVEGWPTASDDPVLQFLYMNISEYLFNMLFQAKLGEAIDKYEPDMIWFDGRMSDILEPYHLNFLAYYFNQADKWGKDVMVTTKKLQYPQEVAVLDFEKGRTAALTPYPWLNDDTISTGSWCYTDTLAVKPAKVVVHDFIDSVSKNGHLLLNLSPKSDGTIPQDQRDCLLAFGDWLKRNGEAIYATRPWLEYGEGPTQMERAGSHQRKSLEYSGSDLRYTQSKDGKTLYMIALGEPVNGIVAPSIIQIDESESGKVVLVGRDEELKFEVTEGRLTIHAPKNLATDFAHAFKLTGFKARLTPDAKARRDAELEKLHSGPIDPGKLHNDNIQFGQ
ncbi:alpha-L-fucosidase [Planctomycetes bacterium CA13]